MYNFGSIVLVPFPFTDLTAAKLRPALILSKKNSESPDVIVCFITSKSKDILSSCEFRVKTNDRVFTGSGLKVESIIRFDKIATLNKKLIMGELGNLDKQTLKKLKKPFLAAFGF